MTDRDTFAAAALTGLLSNNYFSLGDEAAKRCYGYADAMLRERERPDRPQPIKPADATPDTHATPAAGSVPGEGTVGERLIERFSITHTMLDDNEKLRAEIATLREAVRRLADQDATLSVQDGSVTVTLDATLTDEEREAIGNMIHLIERKYEDYGKEAYTLRSLLERLPTT
jgi:hypothetical protein